MVLEVEQAQVKKEYGNIEHCLVYTDIFTVWKLFEFLVEQRNYWYNIVIGLLANS